MQDIIINLITAVIIAGSIVVYTTLFYKGYKQSKADGCTLSQFALAFCYVVRESYRHKITKHGTLGTIFVIIFSLVITVAAWYLGFHILVGYWVLEALAIVALKLLPEPKWNYMEKFQVDIAIITGEFK